MGKIESTGALITEGSGLRVSSTAQNPLSFNQPDILSKRKMPSFNSFTLKIEKLAKKILAGDIENLDSQKLNDLLGETIGNELKRAVPLSERQEMGAFFTGEKLRHQALSSLDRPYSVLDPACGAGDLLLSYANNLPIYESLEDTLLAWKDYLYGYDLEDLFLRICKARLVILAHTKGARRKKNNRIKLNRLFGNIRKANALTQNTWPQTDHIALNPPYVYMQSDESCTWTRGHVSSAAVFIEHCLKKGKSASSVIAILPDVLRTGSRYERWRELVEKERYISRTFIYGAFDPQVDVDVFILELTKQASLFQEMDKHAWIQRSDATNRLADFFHVSVGSVVPHRDPEAGPDCVYIHTKDAPAWGEIDIAPSNRLFSGTTHTAPFVIIRRTSSPSDKNRATGTLVTCEGKVAVENHLIVVKPISKKIEDCHLLLEVLRRDETNIWLNDRIRCRHLTVSAIKDIPWPLQN